MNRRRFFIAFLTASFATLVADVLLNAVVFRGVYQRAAPFLLPPDQLNARVPLGWGALLVVVGVFGYLFVRGGWMGRSDGLRFGLALAITSVAGAMGLASVVAWPGELLAAIGVQQFVNGLLLGGIFGLMYRPRPESGRASGHTG